MDQDRRQEYLNVFMSDYDSLLCIDLAEDTAEAIMEAGILKYAEGKVPYSAGILKKIMAAVAPEYQPWAEEQLSLENMIRELRDQDIFKVVCQLKDDLAGKAEVRLFRRENGEPVSAILALRKPVRRGQLEKRIRGEDRDSLFCIRKKMELELGHHQEMIEGLTREYESVFLVDLNTLKYQTLRLNDRLKDYISEHLVQDYFSSFRSFCAHRVYLNDREPMLEAISPEGIRISLAENDEFALVFRVIRESGPVYIRAKVVRVGKKNGPPDEALIGFANIQEERRAELQQRLLIESALKQAKQADAAKTMFLSNMSHDIRTPLNAILGYVTLASLQPDRREIVEDSLRKIRISGEHLLGLIENVLDVSRIESGRMELHEIPCSLEATVRNSVSMIQQETEQKKQELTVRISPELEDRVVCDEVRLTQILSNLLGNASKYTPEGGHISLEVRQGNRYADREEAVFTVRDDGIGMSEEFRKHIFEPFERENNTTVSRVAGSGLGMSICRGLTGLMGGNIHVESSRNSGTTVEVRLELRIEQSRDRDDEKSANEDGAGIRSRIFEENMGRVRKYTGIPEILLAEDNTMNREIAVRMLRYLGFNVRTAKNGEQALRMVLDAVSGNSGAIPDVILMDIQMPVMDGYTAAERIRAIQGQPGQEIPIVALTADAFASDITHARRSGMNAFIAKPIDLGILKEIIETFAEREGEADGTEE